MNSSVVTKPRNKKAEALQTKNQASQHSEQRDSKHGVSAPKDSWEMSPQEALRVNYLDFEL